MHNPSISNISFSPSFTPKSEDASLATVWAKLDATWSVDDEVTGDIPSSDDDGDETRLAIEDGAVEPDGDGLNGDGVDSDWEEHVGSTQKEPEVPFSSYYTDDDEDEEDVPTTQPEQSEEAAPETSDKILDIPATQHSPVIGEDSPPGGDGKDSEVSPNKVDERDNGELFLQFLETSVESSSRYFSMLESVSQPAPPNQKEESPKKECEAPGLCSGMPPPAPPSPGHMARKHAIKKRMEEIRHWGCFNLKEKKLGDHPKIF